MLVFVGGFMTVADVVECFPGNSQGFYPGVSSLLQPPERFSPQKKFRPSWVINGGE